ncbi:hypothetical protein ACFY1U_28650 [Streptomyces sp. NPDC001351]|uniref:hypothetical protein n=1 Tax=Streptomyces sp. NPDC001351 TaxID=3364564 RepID=UPI0036BE4ACA
MTAISFDDLINAERAVLEAHGAVRDVPYSAEAWKPWVDAAADFQAKVTKYAREQGADRVSVEMDVKKAVRHPQPEDDAA